MGDLKFLLDKESGEDEDGAGFCTRLQAFRVHAPNICKVFGVVMSDTFSAYYAPIARLFSLGLSSTCEINSSMDQT